MEIQKNHQDLIYTKNHLTMLTHKIKKQVRNWQHFYQNAPDADFSTTMDIYSHVLEDMEKEAADKLNNVFSDNENDS